MRYLIISNGCGAGHAVRDLVLADEIRRRSDGAEIYFASYAAGLSVFHSIGETVIDLKQEERPDPDVIGKVLSRVIQEVHPDVLISDEVIAALGHDRTIKTYFLTNHLNIYEYSYAYWVCESILFAELPDSLGSLLQDRKKIRTIGPIVRERFDIPDLTVSEPSDQCLHVWVGGSQLKALQLENIWLFKNLFEQLDNRKIYVHGIEYERFFRKVSLPNVFWVERDYSQKPYQQGVQITRGGIQTLWEMALTGAACIAVPYSDKVNPQEIKYAKVMEKRDLCKLVQYQDIREKRLKEVVEEVEAAKSVKYSRYLQNRGYQLVLSCRNEWEAWMSEITQQ